jgi:hypothetical protein
MEAALDAESWRPSSLQLALDAAQQLCAACKQRGDFNALISSAVQKDSIPESWHRRVCWMKEALQTTRVLR